MIGPIVPPTVGTLGEQDADDVNITGGSITNTSISDADLAKYDDPVANFTGDLQVSGASVLTSASLGTMASQNANNVNITGGSITGISALPITAGGTGATNASNARNNLGLGLMAQQNSNNVTITGGEIDGTLIGATTKAAGSFTTLTATGNVTLGDAYNIDSVRMNARVGINTAASGTLNDLLYVGSSTSTISQYMGVNSALAYECGVKWHSAGNAKWWLYRPPSSDQLRLYTATADMMTFTQDGKVGIGTTAPTEQLETLLPARLDGVRIGNANNQYNVAIGDLALLANLTGSLSTAVGYAALRNSTMDNNTAVGVYAMTTNTSGIQNVAVGSRALETNTTGSNNTALGFLALYSNTTASNNTAVGFESLFSNTLGASNSALGYRSLYSNVSGYDNVAMGYGSLYSNNSGIRNVALGWQSMNGNTTGTRNVAIGAATLFANQTGSNNVAIGNYAMGTGANTADGNTAVGNAAMQFNTSGYNCAAFGSVALTSQTTGYNNTALGVAAMRNSVSTFNSTAVGLNAMRECSGNENSAVGYFSLYNVTGSQNTALGNYSLVGVRGGGQNTAVGYSAANGVSTTTGSGNCAFGWRALYSFTSGTYNIAIGYNTATTITTGGSNIIVGNNSDPSAATGINQIVIGNVLSGKGNNTAYIGGSVGTYNQRNASTWSVTSDQRIKKNIIDNTDGLALINGIRVRNFEYRAKDEITELPQSSGVDIQGVQLGVIAQELQQVLPECVKESEDGVLSVDNDNLVWYLINAVKELSAKVDALEAGQQGGTT